MADFISRIGGVGPGYPIRPPKRPQTDDDPREQRKRPQKKAPDDGDDAAGESVDDGSTSKHIDERV